MGRTTAIQKGKMRTDGMFALRQLVEKRFEMQGRMVVGFVDLLRKMVYADDLAIIVESKQELQTRTTGSVGGIEEGVQEARTENEPGEDRSDVGWTPKRGADHHFGQ